MENALSTSVTYLLQILISLQASQQKDICGNTLAHVVHICGQTAHRAISIRGCMHWFVVLEIANMHTVSYQTFGNAGSAVYAGMVVVVCML